MAKRSFEIQLQQLNDKKVRQESAALMRRLAE